MMRNPYMDYFGRTTPQYYSAEQVQGLANELRRVKAIAQQQQDQVESLKAKLHTTQRALAQLENQAAQPTDDYETQVAQLQAEVVNWQARFAELAAVQADEPISTEPIRDQTDFLLEVLPFVDNLERALTADADGDSALHQGIELTLRAFHNTLAKLGVTPIKVDGAAFDPHLHEALGVMSGTDSPEGTITHVEQNGYTYGDRLLRPARVMVSGGTNA